MSAGGGGRKEAARSSHEEHEEHENHERWLGQLRRHDDAADGAVHRAVRDEPGRPEEVRRARPTAWPTGFGAPSVAFERLSGTTLDEAGNASGASPIDPGAKPGDGDRHRPTVDAQDAGARRRPCSAADRAEASSDARRAHEGGREPQGDRRRRSPTPLAKAKLARHGQVHHRRARPGGHGGHQRGGLRRRPGRPAGRRREILDAIAPALPTLPNNIEVDGHTNQLKVPTANYPSGWELSTARASTRGPVPDRARPRRGRTG